MLRFIWPLLISSSAFASTVQPCLSFVKEAEGYLVSDLRTQDGRSVVRFRSESETFELQPRAKAIDVIIERGSAYILTSGSIEKWSLDSRTFEKNAPIGLPGGGSDRAFAAVKAGDRIFIAQGRSGLAIFDIKSGLVVKRVPLASSNGPLESSARGIVLHGNLLYLALDNFSLTPPGHPQAFSGLVIVDAVSGEVLKELKGFDPGVTSLSGDGESLFASFGGIPIWQYSMKRVNAAREVLPAPIKRVWSFPEEGHPIGHAAADGSVYSSCFSYKDPSSPFYRGKLVHFSYASLGFLNP